MFVATDNDGLAVGPPDGSTPLTSLNLPFSTVGVHYDPTIDGAGNFSVSPSTFPAGACGIAVQILDATTCLFTNVANS